MRVPSQRAYYLDQFRFGGDVVFAGLSVFGPSTPAPGPGGCGGGPAGGAQPKNTTGECCRYPAGPGCGPEAGNPEARPPTPPAGPAATPGPETPLPRTGICAKPLEDGTNESGAADFSHGEMEMRRLDRGTSLGGRVLLHAYGLVFRLRLTRFTCSCRAGGRDVPHGGTDHVWGSAPPGARPDGHRRHARPRNRIYLVIDRSDPGLS